MNFLLNHRDHSCLIDFLSCKNSLSLIAFLMIHECKNKHKNIQVSLQAVGNYSQRCFEGDDKPIGDDSCYVI